MLKTNQKVVIMNPTDEKQRSEPEYDMVNGKRVRHQGKSRKPRSKEDVQDKRFLGQGTEVRKG